MVDGIGIGIGIVIGTVVLPLQAKYSLGEVGSLLVWLVRIRNLELCNLYLLVYIMNTTSSLQLSSEIPSRQDFLPA